MKNSKFKADNKNKLERREELINQKVPGRGDVGYMQEHLITGVFPHRDPKSRDYSIRNGHTKVTVSTEKGINDKLIGIPYGSLPRLFIAYICTQAVTVKNRKVSLGENLTDFLRKLDLGVRGGKRGDITRVKKQLWRFVNCSISYHIETDEMKESGGFRLSEQARIFTGKNTDQGEIFESYILLSETFYKAILKNPVPVDIRMLKAHKNSPLALDLYMWLTYRVFGEQRKNSFISYPQIMAQCGANYSNIKRFGQEVRKIVKGFKVFWPGLHVEFPKGGIKIYASSNSHVLPKKDGR